MVSPGLLNGEPGSLNGEPRRLNGESAVARHVLGPWESGWCHPKYPAPPPSSHWSFDS